MQFYDALYKIARSVGMSVNDIGVALGKTYTYVPSAKHRKSVPTVSNASKMLGTCGYALCAVKREDVTRSMYRID